jgi:hypothetical protein
LSPEDPVDVEPAVGVFGVEEVTGDDKGDDGVRVELLVDNDSV